MAGRHDRRPRRGDRTSVVTGVERHVERIALLRRHVERGQRLVRCSGRARRKRCPGLPDVRPPEAVRPDRSRRQTEQRAGTGTLLCLATRSIRSYCFWRSYVGKTGTSLAAGATRATNEPLPSFHVASKKSDSLDMPFDSGDDTGPITASGSSVVATSHACSRPRNSSGVREVLTTFISSLMAAR